MRNVESRTVLSTWPRPRDAHAASRRAVRGARWWAAVAMVFLGLQYSPPSYGHENAALTFELDGSTKVLRVVRGDAHLVPGESIVDFGEVVLPGSRTLPLTLTNAVDRAVTVDVSAPTDVTLSTNQLSMAPGGAASLSVTWSPNQSGTLDDVLALSVRHDGVAAPYAEAVALRGEAGTVDLVFDVPTFGEMAVDAVDFGRVGCSLTNLCCGVPRIVIFAFVLQAMVRRLGSAVAHE